MFIINLNTTGHIYNVQPDKYDASLVAITLEICNIQYNSRSTNVQISYNEPRISVIIYYANIKSLLCHKLNGIGQDHVHLMYTHHFYHFYTDI